MCGRVSRLTRTRRLQIEIELRRAKGNKKRRLMRELRALKRATLVRGRLRLGREKLSKARAKAIVQASQQRALAKDRDLFIGTKKQKREFEKLPNAVTAPRPAGGTITVSKRGLVSERDQRGRLIRRFQTSRSSAKRFIVRLGATAPGKIDFRKESIRIRASKQLVSALTSDLVRKGIKTTITKQKAEAKRIKEGRLTITERLTRQRSRILKEKEQEKIRMQQEITPSVRPVITEFKLLTLGGIRGVIGAGQFVFAPKKVIGEQIAAFKQPKKLIKALGNEFIMDPVGTITAFVVYGKTLGLVGTAIKRTPVGQWVVENGFVQAQPTQLRAPVRSILRANRVQRAINPLKIKKLTKAPSFMKVKSLSKVEAIALKKTLRSTDSVLFGSAGARALAGKFKSRLPIPKDVDIGVASISLFNKKFIANLPLRLRKFYKLRGGKLIRTTNNQALYDIKSFSKLFPNRSLVSPGGRLPVSGYVRKFTRKKGSILPEFKKGVKGGVIDVPAGKVVTIKGIKVVGFGAQAQRKALGTLQVLIEKNVRRAKDPQAFLISLEIQRAGLRARLLKARGILKLPIKRKISILSSTIKLLKSKSFARLLEQKVPGITKKFPLVSRINVKRLKAINLKTVRRKVLEATKPGILTKKETKTLKRLKNQLRIAEKKKFKTPLARRKNQVVIRKLRSRINKIQKKPSILPSKLPKRVKPSRIPSKLPKKKITPSRIPTPSNLKKLVPSFIPISALPSRLGISRAPPSRAPISRITPSKVKPSKISKSKLARSILKERVSRIKAKKKRLLKVKKVVKKIKKKKIRQVINRQFVFLADLIAILEGEKASPSERKAFLKVGRVFTGIFRRKIV